jgi:hypothetical protein
VRSDRDAGAVVAGQERDVDGRARREITIVARAGPP